MNDKAKINGNRCANGDSFTKRELFAAMAMQGLATMEYHKWENLAADAVNVADALLNALEESSHE